MLGNFKIIKLIFDRSAFSAREPGGKYGNSCYQIAYNPIQAHCDVYEFVCSTKLIHLFLHEKYALMRVLLLFYCQCVPTWDTFFFPFREVYCKLCFCVIYCTCINSTVGVGLLDIIVSNKVSKPLYEQIASQIKAAIISGELSAGELIPSMRSLAKSLHISVLTVQKAYETLQDEGFIETTAGKGCYVSVQNQDFYLEEQQKKIEEKFVEAIDLARSSGIKLDKLINLLTLLYEED